MNALIQCSQNQTLALHARINELLNESELNIKAINEAMEMLKGLIEADDLEKNRLTTENQLIRKMSTDLRNSISGIATTLETRVTNLSAQTIKKQQKLDMLAHEYHKHVHSAMGANSSPPQY